VINTQLLSHAPGVVNITHRAAAGIALAAPQAHGDTNDLVALATQFSRSN
jgi:hypothetical protein